MKTYTHNLLSAAVVAAITFSGAAIADEYQTLETTTVTAGRFEQDLMETPMSVSVITADDIAKSGAQSIGALIESMTGVRINNDGGQGIKRAKIRRETLSRDRKLHGTLRIGTIESICTVLLPQVMKQYHTLYPEVNVRITHSDRSGHG